MIASTDFLNALAWSLLHFVWQGAAIAALAAALLFVFRKPDARYLIGIGALALMFLSFAVTFALVNSGTSDGQTTSAARAPAAALASPEPDAIAISTTMLAGSQAAMTSGEFLWIARLWLVGVCVLALRIAFGLFVLEQVRRRNLVELPPQLVARFRALQARLGIHRVVRYCECPRIGVPAVIGFFRPIVLLPMRALTGLTPEQLEAVIAHELGHVKRFDVAVNFLQVIAETLFFFHPAVWWLNRRIRADREDCCDDVAVRACGESVGYARALASMATWRHVPALAMASTGGPVAARVARLLGMRAPSGEPRTANVFTATLVLATALIAGAISIGLVQPAFARDDDVVTKVEEAADAEAIDPALEFELAEAAAIAEATQNVTVELGEPAAPEHVTAPLAPLAALEPLSSLAPLAPMASAEPVASPAPSAPMPAAPVPRVVPSPAPAPMPRIEPIPPLPAAPKPPKPYIDEMKFAGLENLDADMLVAFKNQDITFDFVHEMQQVDVNIDANTILAMKVHGITSNYVQGVHKLGFKPSAEEIVAMKVHGIGTDYVSDMRKLGFDPLVQELIAMRNQGVTPEYVKEMRSAGFKPTAEELIQMKVFEITPEFRRTFERNGYKLGVSQLVEAKVMDITTAFIEKVRAHGFKDLTLQQLIQLKNADVL